MSGPAEGTRQGESRVSLAIRYMFEHHCTQAAAARMFGISKTTVSVSLRRYDEQGNLKVVRAKKSAEEIAKLKRAYHERTRDQRRGRNRGRKRERNRRSHLCSLDAITAEGIRNAALIGSAVAIATGKAIYILHTETDGHPAGKVAGIRVSW